MNKDFDVIKFEHIHLSSKNELRDIDIVIDLQNGIKGLTKKYFLSMTRMKQIHYKYYRRLAYYYRDDKNINIHEYANSFFNSYKNYLIEKNKNPEINEKIIRELGEHSVVPLNDFLKKIESIREKIENTKKNYLRQIERDFKIMNDLIDKALEVT